MDGLFDNLYCGEGDVLIFKVDIEQFVNLGLIEKLKYGLCYDKCIVEDYDYLGVGGNVVMLLIEFDDGFIYINSDFFDGCVNFLGIWVVVNVKYIVQNCQEICVLYGYDDVIDQVLGINFEIEEVFKEVYVEVDFVMEVGGKIFDGQFGVCVERVDCEMIFYDGDFVLEGEGLSILVLLSFVVCYYLVDDIIICFVYIEIVCCLDFVVFNLMIFYGFNLIGFELKMVGQGNLDLGLVELINFDFFLEWYFLLQSLVYVVWFQCDIKGFVFDFKCKVIL